MKCNLIQPSCSRCTRLGITCLGCSKKRYKFVKNQWDWLKPTRLIRSTHLILAAPKPGILWTPTNEGTVVAGAFCAVLQVSDARSDLSTSGAFLKDIPRREPGARCFFKSSYERFHIAVFVGITGGNGVHRKGNKS
jgi:hypothetical protein